MRTIRYLTFEISRDCDMATEHADKCPIAHPERYRWSASKRSIDDDLIFDFWAWARQEKHFRGIVMFNSYNEPTLSIERIRVLKARMLIVDPWQPFQITTNSDMPLDDFDIVARSHYGGPHYRGSSATLDNRMASAKGEGKPYREMKPVGRCGRGLGWEVLIDYFGNWCLCCNDWRNEESFGSIVNTSWETLYKDWTERRSGIKWETEAEYKDLPRMCRACLDVNPALSQKAGI